MNYLIGKSIYGSINNSKDTHAICFFFRFNFKLIKTKATTKTKSNKNIK